MSQRTLMASDSGEWTQHDSPQTVRPPLFDILRRILTLTPSKGRDSHTHVSSGQRMDGIHDGSPLAWVIQVWDQAEDFLETYPSLPLTLCVVCVYLCFFGSSRNVAIILALVGWSKRASIETALTRFLPLNVLLGTLLVVVVFWRVIKLLSSWLSRVEGEDFKELSRPYLIPSKTTHTRLVPKKHSFDYSYLLVGIPVGWEGNANGMVSVDASKRSMAAGSAAAWYNVESAEYLERGAQHLGLRGRLETFLRSQAVDPSSYPHAYFVTAPKFLGYSFNPVSFWYLYSGKKILSAIVLEVNNTFGERRPYLVTRDFDTESQQLHCLAGNNGHVPRAKIKNSWAKDFHVSPFNSRNGTYSVVAADPLGEGLKGFRGVDVTINLVSSKGQSKVVARLFSDGTAVDPSSLSLIQRLKFVSSWSWVGFVTVPRIIAEAAKLSLKRKLHVWYRPEPLKESMGRLADGTEAKFEATFRAYLRSLVNQSPTPLRVTYVPCGMLDRAEEIFDSPNAVSRSTELQEVRIKVLTPAFYTRFIGYAHDVEAIFCEMAESCTLWVDKPDVLPQIFVKKPLPPLQSTSLVDFASFKLIKALRRRPDTIKRPMTSADTPAANTRASDIRDFRMSSMDAFVLGQDSVQLKKDYRYAALVLFIADKFFFGLRQLLEAMMLLGNLGLAITMASILSEATTAKTW